MFETAHHSLVLVGSSEGIRIAGTALIEIVHFLLVLLSTLSCIIPLPYYTQNYTGNIMAPIGPAEQLLLASLSFYHAKLCQSLHFVYE